MQSEKGRAEVVESGESGYPEMRRKIFIAVSFIGMGIVGLMLLFSLSCSKGDKKPAGPRPVLVLKAVAQQKDVPVQIKTIGRVEAYNSVAIKPRISAYITAVHIREGQDVRKGDLLFTLDSRSYEAELKQAESRLERDVALLKNAESEYQRYEKLYSEQFATKQQFDRVRTEVEALSALLRADKADVENAKVRLSYSAIRAPIDGKAGAILVDKGNLVKVDDTMLVTINQIAPIYVSVSVPEKYLPEIKKQMSKSGLTLKSVISGDEKNPREGNVTFIDNAVDNATGTIKLKGVFPNRDRGLWPGQFVDSVLNIGILKAAVTVPSQAVQTGQAGTFIFVVKSDMTVESRPVVLGPAYDGEVVVEKGVAAGEKVVTDGQLRLTQGAKIEDMEEKKAEKKNDKKEGVEKGK